MQWIELENYALPVSEESRVIETFSFSISRGDICWLDADVAEDALLFFKALATLVTPLAGNYFFEGQPLDFTRPATLLTMKKTIGYITTHSTLISNRSLRENLTLMRSYADNNLSARIDDDLFELCGHFSIADKVDLRPEELEQFDRRAAIVIREVTKATRLLLLEKPEIYLGHTGFVLYDWLLRGLMDQGVPMVFTSDDKKFIDSVSNRALVLHHGRLEEEA
jgi:ABC-type ATPase involved in cell division